MGPVPFFGLPSRKRQPETRIMASEQISSQPPSEPRLPPALCRDEALEVPSSNDCNLAVLAHVGGFFTSVLVPLVLYIAVQERSRFVVHHSREALNFQISQMVYGLLLLMVNLLVLVALGLSAGWEWGVGLAVAGFFLPAIVLAVVEIVLVVKACVACLRGGLFRYPLCLRPIR
jgi:uncharacterized protein